MALNAEYYTGSESLYLGSTDNPLVKYKNTRLMAFPSVFSSVKLGKRLDPSFSYCHYTGGESYIGNCQSSVRLNGYKIIIKPQTTCSCNVGMAYVPPNNTSFIKWYHTSNRNPFNYSSGYTYLISYFKTENIVYLVRVCITNLLTGNTRAVDFDNINLGENEIISNWGIQPYTGTTTNNRSATGSTSSINNFIETYYSFGSSSAYGYVSPICYPVGNSLNTAGMIKIQAQTQNKKIILSQYSNIYREYSDGINNNLAPFILTNNLVTGARDSTSFTIMQNMSLSIDFERYLRDYTTRRIIHQNDGCAVVQVDSINFNIFKKFNKEMIAKSVSAMGLYWTGTTSVARTAVTGTEASDPLLHLGVIYDDGHTDGSYISGESIKTSMQARLNEIIEQRTVPAVDPAETVKDNNSSTDSPTENTFPKNRTRDGSVSSGYGDLTLARSCSGFAVFNGSSLGNLISTLSSIASTDSTFWEKLGHTEHSTGSRVTDNTVTTTNEVTTISGDSSYIGNYILSCRQYPFNVIDNLLYNHETNKVSSTKLHFGFNGASIDFASTKIINPICYFNFGEITIEPYEGQTAFWDFEPYTNISIYLPAVGIMPLSSSQCMNCTLKLEAIVDLISGMITYVLTSIDDELNTLPILCKTGKIGYDVSLSGNDFDIQSQNILNAQFNNVRRAVEAYHSAKNIIGDVSKTAKSVTSGSYGSAVSSVADITSNLAMQAINIAEGKLETTLASRDVPKTITSTSGNSSMIGSTKPYISLQRPIITIPNNFGHTHGYMLNESSKLSDLYGFTICFNPDLTNISATEQEKSALYQILTTGFYI